MLQGNTKMIDKTTNIAKYNVLQGTYIIRFIPITHNAFIIKIEAGYAHQNLATTTISIYDFCDLYDMP